VRPMRHDPALRRGIGIPRSEAQSPDMSAECARVPAVFGTSRGLVPMSARGGTAEVRRGSRSNRGPPWMERTAEVTTVCANKFTTRLG
jgi:hypothetical protein